MDDIAREGGLSKGTLYRCLTSKDDPSAAILRRLFAGELGEPEVAPSARGQPAGTHR
jgi:AcrR family transcriptional regulator